MSQENRTSLQKQIEEAETKIKQLEHQNTRLENRGRYLQKGERAKRTHHLCLPAFLEEMLREVEDC